MKKKIWTEPELIVLVRSKPEEAILRACKTDVNAGPVETFRICIVYTVGCDWCTDFGWS